MKKLIYLLSAIFFVLVSCSNDDSSTLGNTNPNEVLLQRTVTKSASNHSSLDVNGMMTTLWVYNGKKLAYTQTSRGVKTNYFYTGNLITRIVKTEGTSSISSIYAYDDTERLASITTNGVVTASFTYNLDGTVTILHSGNTEHISFSDGEVSKIVTNHADSFSTTHEYTYDDKNSPTKNIIGFDKIYLNLEYPNGNFKNVVTRSYSNSDGDAGDVTKAITYNALGFPVLVNSNDYFGIDTYITQYFYN